MRASRQVVDREGEVELAARMARPVESLPGRHRAVREGPRDTGRLARLVRRDRGDDHALPAADGDPVRVGRHRGPREGPRRHGVVRLPRLLARAVGPGGRSGSVAVPVRLQPAASAGGPRSVSRRRLPRRVRSGGRRVLLGGAGGGRGRPGAVIRTLPVFAAAEAAPARWNEDSIKESMVSLTKSGSLPVETSRFFRDLYLVLLGSEQGPRAAPFLAVLEKDWVLRRLKEAAK